MRRDNSIQIRVSTTEKEELARRAAEQGIDVATLIRLALGLSVK